ncbi:hypothetical protein AB837_00322 [bacterium AB1]|nr:hypothetical protein AB837_00322 [bacterium AB1]
MKFNPQEHCIGFPIQVTSKVQREIDYVLSEQVQHVVKDYSKKSKDYSYVQKLLYNSACNLHINYYFLLRKYILFCNPGLYNSLALHVSREKTNNMDKNILSYLCYKSIINSYLQSTPLSVKNMCKYLYSSSLRFTLSRCKLILNLCKSYFINMFNIRNMSTFSLLFGMSTLVLWSMYSNNYGVGKDYNHGLYYSSLSNAMLDLYNPEYSEILNSVFIQFNISHSEGMLSEICHGYIHGGAMPLNNLYDTMQPWRKYPFFMYVPSGLSALKCRPIENTLSFN